MLFEKSLEAVVAKEPWRQRVGYPLSVTDPDWTAQAHEPCSGDVEYENGTKFWVCTSCGYIGWATTHQHYPITSTEQYYQRAYQLFMEKQKSDGGAERANFVMGAALRAAANKSPSELRAFVEKLSRL